MPDPRRIILSDQYPWTFTCSTISYEVPPWFLLLGRIVDKMWDLSPMQRPKFLLPHSPYRSPLVNLNTTQYFLETSSWDYYPSCEGFYSSQSICGWWSFNLFGPTFLALTKGSHIWWTLNISSITHGFWRHESTLLIHPYLHTITRIVKMIN